jgi:3-phosphoshikimate 1-carboxyvinyltransferase
MIQSIQRANSLSGTVALPGDKSISHRYAMLAAIAEGASELRHFARSRDCHSTLGCLRSLGVDVRTNGEDVFINGRGLHGLQKPQETLDAGNSGTTIRLLSGILAGCNFESAIAGDESLCGRPMKRIMQPLQLMGAQIEARNGNFPPLHIRGGNLKAVRYSLPVASAQVKSCVLLAGLYGEDTSAVRELAPTRDHTEIALCHFGASLRKNEGWIEIDPEPHLQSQRLNIPGDLSGAAFFLVAAAMVPGSDLVLPAVGLNGRRRKLLDYLTSSGANLVVENECENAGEVRGDLRTSFSAALMNSHLLPIRGEWVAALIDEIPVLAILGSQVDGGLEVSDAGELRVKESDRIAAIALNLRAMGAEVEEKADGFVIPGRQKLRGADIFAAGDHRIAMAFAIAGLVADGETRIHEAECADVSFPGFWETLAGTMGTGKIQEGPE